MGRGASGFGFDVGREVGGKGCFGAVLSRVRVDHWRAILLWIVVHGFANVMALMGGQVGFLASVVAREVVG